MIYFEIINIKTDKLIAENICDLYCNAKYCFNGVYLDKKQTFCSAKDGIRSGYIKTDDISVWVIVVDEIDFIKSKKRFDILLKAYLVSSQTLLKYFVNKVKAHSHILRTTQGQMKQKIEGFARPKAFRGNTYEEQKGNIQKIINNDLVEAADLVCYLNKRTIDIESHIEIFDLLYNEDFNIKTLKQKPVNIYKVLQNIIAPFYDDLGEKDVHIKFDIDDNFAKKNLIWLNYKIFKMALHNFFDNAVKYSEPSTTINVSICVVDGLIQIVIEMMSCRIDKSEIDKIFEEGYSGRKSMSKGDGIGMYVMKKCLEKIDMSIKVEPIHSEGDKQYTKNRFIIFKVRRNNSY